MNVSRQKGYVLAVLIITVLFVSLSITYVTSLSLTTYNLATRDTYRANAQMTADAALDLAMTTLNTVGSAGLTTTYSSEQTFMSSGSLTTTYQTALLDGVSSDKKVLSVIARTKVGGDTEVTRRYELDVQAVTTGSGPSSVVTGVGGLLLNNNSRITGGDVVVNGTISVSNNAQIGLSTTAIANAVNVRVAHTNCPIPATSAFPRVCASGENGQPITLSGNAKIYGDVRATNQTTGTNMSNPGLIPNQTVSPLTLPSYDRDGQKAAVTTTITGASAGCSGGTRTWAANTKITGNVTIQNNCTVTVNGNIWITGLLNINNNARIVVANSLGTTRPTIMVDGAGTSGSNVINIGNNGIIQPNSSGTGAMFISYWSSASCAPDCSDVTGTNLYTSKDVRSLELSNNGSASNSILYARWSKVRISNNGAIGAVAGQTIELGNNAVINFTASVPGSSNLTTTWAKRGYMRVYQ